MRKAIGAHLRLPGLPREKVLAAVVRLLETTFIRIGNEKYVRENGSFGLTTLRNRHVRIRGQTLQFDFRGKSGKQHHIEFLDAGLPPSCADAVTCRDRNCFSIWTKTAKRAQFPRPMSTNICPASAAVNLTRQRTFAPGRGPCSRRSHCISIRTSAPKRGPKKTWSKRSGSRAAPGQYACDLPQVLYPSGRSRRLFRGAIGRTTGNEY